MTVEIPFTHTTIDQNPAERPWYKMAGDINGDGLPDIVVAGAKESLVAYLAPDWRKIEIADEGWSGVNGEIADLDIARANHAGIQPLELWRKDRIGNQTGQ